MFAADVDRWTKRALEAAEHVLVDATTAVADELIKRSPVASGQFVGSWRVVISESAPAPAYGPFQPDRGRRRTRKRLAQQIAQARIGRKLWIINEAPYAFKLEYGGSKRAPNGFARITARRWRRLVRRAATKANRRDFKANNNAGG